LGHDFLHRTDIRNRLVLVDFPDGAPNRRCEAHRIDIRPDDQRTWLEELGLFGRELHLQLRIGSELELPHVLYYSDDLHPRRLRLPIRRPSTNSLADGIFARPQTTSGHFANDHHTG
jgi:hypothetical protein